MSLQSKILIFLKIHVTNTNWDLSYNSIESHIKKNIFGSKYKKMCKNYTIK